MTKPTMGEVALKKNEWRARAEKAERERDEARIERDEARQWLPVLERERDEARERYSASHLARATATIERVKALVEKLQGQDMVAMADKLEAALSGKQPCPDCGESFEFGSVHVHSI